MTFQFTKPIIQYRKQHIIKIKSVLYTHTLCTFAVPGLPIAETWILRISDPG